MMSDHAQKVAQVQEQILEALNGSTTARVTRRPRTWDGNPFNASMVPIAVIDVHRLEYDNHTHRMISRIVAENHVTMMTRNDVRLRPRKMLVYIQKKKTEL